MINEIKGNNIILREQKIEDVKFFTYWYNQPLVMFQCGFTKLTDEETEKERITIGHKQKDSVWYTITDLYDQKGLSHSLDNPFHCAPSGARF